MFKDFDISSFKKMKPPGDNTFDTMQEIKELESIPLNKKFVKDNDDIEMAYLFLFLVLFISSTAK